MVTIKTWEKDGKRHSTIELKNGVFCKLGFTFGLSKARLILENYEDIRQFVQDNTEIK